MSLSTHITPDHTDKPAAHNVSIPSQGHARTSVETRTDLSTLYRLLRTFIRPLRPRLVGIKPLNATGSPRLANRPSSHYGVSISERFVQVPATEVNRLTQADPTTNTQKLWLYDFIPKSVSTRQASKPDPWWNHTIYYFAGGGFQAPGSAEHWKLTARLAKDLSPRHVRVVMVSYPLAPKSPAKDSLPLLRAWLAQVLATTTETNETISLMGDSAGANIALSLAFWWSTLLARMVQQNDSEHITGWKNLIEILIMSPPCDFRNTNPEIEEADKIDPVLTKDVTGGAADAWCTKWDESSLTKNPPNDTLPDPIHPEFDQVDGGDAKMYSKSDPALSPNLQTPEAWTAMVESGLVIHGVIGTADRLAPDGKIFMGRCVEVGVKGAWLIWEGQMHCFPLTVCYGVSEGREGYDWVRKKVESVLK